MILNQIKSLQIDYRKQKKDIEISILTVLISDMLKIGKDKRNSLPTEDECCSILKKYIKNIEETLSLSISDEAKTKLLLEKNLISSLLPKQATQQELSEFISQNCFESKSELFKALKEAFGNNFDANLVNVLWK